MLLIQNYQLNRQKSDPQQVQYNFGLNANPAELSSSYSTHGGNVDDINQATISSSAGNPQSTIEILPKSDVAPVEKVPVQQEQKKEENKPTWQEQADQGGLWWANTSWGTSSGKISSSSSKPMTQNQASSAQTPNKATGQNPTGTQPPSQKDWNTLQQEQTKNIRDLIAQMNQPKPKQQKKKKKKAKKDPNVASPAKPGNASNQQQQQKKTSERSSQC